VLDDLVDLLGPEQSAVLARVSILPAPLAARPLPTRTWWRRGGILRRRKRRVPRTSTKPTLELGHPGLEPLVRIKQALVCLDEIIETKQQPDRCLTIAIQDRLSLNPLHTTRFAAPVRVPTPAERLPKSRHLQRLGLFKRAL